MKVTYYDDPRLRKIELNKDEKIKYRDLIKEDLIKSDQVEREYFGRDGKATEEDIEKWTARSYEWMVEALEEVSDYIPGSGDPKGHAMDLIYFDDPIPMTRNYWDVDALYKKMGGLAKINDAIAFAKAQKVVGLKLLEDHKRIHGDRFPRTYEMSAGFV